jgi:UDP-N-acetylmuramyl pentapeptide phosphotransferase/UDP-N-acetylglucosamine-1-phosphate transferase
MQALQPYLNYLFSFLAALAISIFSIPNIIYVAKRKRLLDLPDNERKFHKRVVPNLGGIGIFFAFIIATSLFINADGFSKWNYITAAALILFITGIKDDLVQISPTKKFVAQIAAAVITVCLADIRIHSLQGLLGIHEMPVWVSMGFSIIGCVFVTNAFNLIDGIDGLAGSIGVLISGLLGIFLAAEGGMVATIAAIIAFSLAGAIVGFLKYNVSPAKIFMGDTGSLIIGFSIAIISILFINSYQGGRSLFGMVTSAGGCLILALAILFIPVFDTFRVFSMRLSKGRSPFSPDRTHLHHYLVDLGLSHSQTVATIVCVNVLVIILAMGLQAYNVNIAFAALLLAGLSMLLALIIVRRSVQKRTVLQPAITPQATEADGKGADKVNGQLKGGLNTHTSLIVNGKRIVVAETDEVVSF